MPNKSATAPAQPTGKLILIDGHSLAYRAYYAAFPPDGRETGLSKLSVQHDDGTKELTGALFTFSNMLLRIWDEQKPDFIIAAFDLGRTFRDDLYSEYKATRSKMPELLQQQMPRIKEIVKAFDIPIFTKEGFEADDILGTLAKRAAGEGMEVMIVSGDRDGTQLVNPRIKLLTSKQRFDETVIYDESLVQEKYGVRPDQIIDYKALLGDTSDNVPGVKGIGEKTAVALLNAYDNLDAIYAKLDEVKPARAKTALEAGKDSAYLSKTLVTIKTDVPLDVDWEACKAEADYNRVLSLLRELRFESLIKRIPQAAGGAGVEAEKGGQGDKGKGRKGGTGQLGLFGEDEVKAESLIPNPQSPISNPSVPTQVRLVDSDEAYKELLKALNGASLIAFDTETTGTDPMRDEMVGMSFSVKAGEGWYLPTEKTTDNRQQTTDISSSWSLDPASAKFEPIAKALQNKQSQLVCHNAKFDLGVLKNLGVEIHKPVLDTMLAQFLIDPGGQSLGLKNLAFTLLGWQMTEISELIGKGKKQITMREVPVASVAPYAAADADATIHLWELLQPQLIAKKQDALFYDVETPLIPVLLDMEFSGVALDVAYLGELSVQITERLRELEKTIYNEAGTVFNINSPKQLSELLFGKLQLPAEASWKTQSGGLSTNIEVLENLKDKHAVIPPIIEHRELSKLKGTYVDALPQLINPNTGRVHTDFNQAGAVTGRMSSSNPNLQNIPIKSEMGRRVRKAFIARKGNRLISADYSQVELRILAHMADDESMRSAFERGEDIHATTAAAIYDTPLQDVNAMQRSNAKRINFGIAYGMGPFALAQNTGMSMDEARAFINKYFERFPKVKAWLDNTKLIAAEQGFVETVLGRRRYFPELRTGSGAAEMMKRRAEREAINHPVQGSAADIMKIAMIRIHAALREGGYAAKMTLQVHDELVFDCPTGELEAVSKLVKHEMEGAYSMSVPLRADVVSGKNWDDSA